ncbi:Ubiquitin carboxyl-terminal hydrolase [Spraguea lophii 42_110]|uniref:ubiquitinyl hydrolase 1 n=1 Tax=Spraguea lophii (strain 42_110) TaxID=1358809 RepID=S7XGT2_SPRLO|nr:Ubiquitin carboxyl-terminal hydrolase [Spraguea lophii 42_110]
MVQQITKTTLSPTKLINRHNNCFFNSCIQCILSIPSITTYYDSTNFSRNSNISQSFQKFIKEYKKNEIVDPEMLLKDLRRKMDILDGREQDTHEFLVLFLDLLENEVKMKQENIKTEEEIKNSNIILKTFMGLQKTTITCQRCNNASTSVEQSLGISIGVYKDIQEGINKQQEPEILKEGIFCPKCKENSGKLKNTQFFYPPEILVVQLLRFNGASTKNNKRININPTIKLANRNYTLIGSVCHEGTLRNGHYISYGKRDYKWCCYDDSNLKEIENPPLSGSNAYLVFYSRV